MNAQQLYLSDGKPAQNSWQCSACSLVWLDKDRAESCCTCRCCHELVPRESIGKGNYSGYHGACWDAEQKRRDAERRERAVKLEDWDGPVFYDGLHGDWGHGYFSDLGNFIDYFDESDSDEPRQRPEYVFVCEEAGRFCLDADSIIENAAADLFEDAGDFVRGVDEFCAAVDAINEANKQMVSWSPDYTRMVRVPWPTEDAESEVRL